MDLNISKEELKIQIIKKDEKINKLKKEIIVLRKLLEKYNIGNLDEIIKEETIKNLDIINLSKNKRNTIYYDSKEEIIETNGISCLLCNEKTIFNNNYCIRHKMEKDGLTINTENIPNNISKIIPNELNNNGDKIFNKKRFSFPETPISNNSVDMKKEYTHDISELLDNNLKLNEKIKYLKKENKLYKNKNINKLKTKIWIFTAFLKFKKSDYYKSKIIDNSIRPVDINNKSGKNRNRNSNKKLHILERYPIIVYDDIGNSIVKQLIAKETELIICYKNDIADKIKKKIENITIDDVMDYIARHDKLSYQKKSKMKYIFERCEYLYEKYGQYNKLNKFKFNIGSLQHLSKKEWSEWVSELDKLVNIYYPKENICQNIMGNNSKRPGKLCGKIDCKKHNII
jgi:hypothetical protein